MLLYILHCSHIYVDVAWYETEVIVFCLRLLHIMLTVVFRDVCTCLFRPGLYKLTLSIPPIIVPQSSQLSSVRIVLHLHVGKLKGEVLRTTQLSRRREVPHWSIVRWQDEKQYSRVYGKSFTIGEQLCYSRFCTNGGLSIGCFPKQRPSTISALPTEENFRWQRKVLQANYRWFGFCIPPHEEWTIDYRVPDKKSFPSVDAKHQEFRIEPRIEQTVPTLTHLPPQLQLYIDMFSYARFHHCCDVPRGYVGSQPKS